MRTALVWLKKRLYFLVAHYFKFWANLQLKKWQPRVIVVTGSSGKTTLLHLIESQLGNRARFSHQANSTFGIPFNILSLSGVEGNRLKWLSLFILAPIKAFKRPFSERVYVAEVDAERPGEAPFLARLLKPEVTLWISSARTHAVYYDKLVKRGKFSSAETAIASQYTSLLKYTKALAVISGDNPLMVKQATQTKARVVLVRAHDDLLAYKVSSAGAQFKTSRGSFRFRQLLPRVNFYGLIMLAELLDYLDIKIDPDFKKFRLPPGRSSILRGKKGIIMIDSSYNANLDSMSAVLDLFQEYPAGSKWLVLADMIEEGAREAVQHRKLAKMVVKMPVERVILVGRRMNQYAYPLLRKSLKKSVKLVTYTQPKEAWEYLQNNTTGEETILFKGALLLEGIIEHLLANPLDRRYLCRQQPVWRRRRAQWGL